MLLALLHRWMSRPETASPPFRFAPGATRGCSSAWRTGRSPPLAYATRTRPRPRRRIDAG